MAGPQTSERARRKARGDFPTPSGVVEMVLEHTLPTIPAGGVVSVLDPACGDGRFLVAAGQRVRAAGGRPLLHGVELDPDTAERARDALAADGLAGEIAVGDALTWPWGDGRFDVVVGNPPYLSPLAAANARARRLGGGPYADRAAEFLALAVRLARPAGGRVGFVLPQSILASRDAGPVRAEVDRHAALRWSWWSPAKVFDADVVVCALAFELGADPVRPRPWSEVVTRRLGIPLVPSLRAAGTLGDRARATANFRDQYYGLVGAVADDGPGAPLVTSGLIDPARCWWGERPVRFAGSTLTRPRVDLDALSPPLRRWAESMLVPKVLVANQTATIEAVADRRGVWLPSVPVLSLRPERDADVGEIAAVLTSGVAAAWAWSRAAGTGLSATTLRLGPRWLTELPWPAGPLDLAVEALAAGDVDGCAGAIDRAYGVDDPDVHTWWRSRRPTPACM